MSSLLPGLALQMPAFRAPRGLRLWSQDCVLCLAHADRAPLCGACLCAIESRMAACPHCALPLATPAAACPACRRERFTFDAAVTRFEYRFPLDRLVHRFKYGGDLALGRWLARALAERVARECRPDLLAVPPLSSERLRERGFNQALELARVIGRCIHVRTDAHLLARRRNTAAQARLGRRERRENLRGAFRCTRPVDGLDVAIVDDVLTTGATADALAGVLKRAGARTVSVWAVARAPDPSLP
jgi:ComF family protein